MACFEQCSSYGIKGTGVWWCVINKFSYQVLGYRCEIHNPVPANGSNDAGTEHKSSTWRVFAIFSCMKSENALGRSERGMLVGSFGSVVFAKSSSVTL